MLVVAVSAGVTSCSTTQHVYTNTTDPQPPKYSLLIMIHRDANYVFHHTSGVAYHADEVALARARRVALANPQAEVFIFHEKPLRKTLFYF